MTNKNNKLNYRQNVTPINKASSEDHKNIELAQYSEQALSPIHVVDNSPLLKNLKLSTAISHEQLSFFEPPNNNPKKLDRGQFIVTDPNINEIKIEPEDEIILRGVSNLYEKKIENNDTVFCRISSLIREAYGYPAKAKIRDKEYKEFMNRLYKLSNVRVDIQFTEAGSGIMDNETGHVMNSIRRPIVEFYELTNNSEPSAKDYIKFTSKPIMYDYSKHKKYIEHVPKEVLQPPKNVPNNNNYRVIANELYRRINQYKRSLNNKGVSKYPNKIKYETLFKECNMSDISPSQRTRRKATIHTIMDKFANEDNLIKYYYEYDSNGTTKGRPIGLVFVLHEK